MGTPWKRQAKADPVGNRKLTHRRRRRRAGRETKTDPPRGGAPLDRPLARTGSGTARLFEFGYDPFRRRLADRSPDLSPFISRIWAWCITRSHMATARRSDLKTCVHSSKARFEFTTTLPRSCCTLKAGKSGSAPRAPTTPLWCSRDGSTARPIRAPGDAATEPIASAEDLSTTAKMALDGSGQSPTGPSRRRTALRGRPVGTTVGRRRSAAGGGGKVMLQLLRRPGEDPARRGAADAANVLRPDRGRARAERSADVGQDGGEIRVREVFEARHSFGIRATGRCPRTLKAVEGDADQCVGAAADVRRSDQRRRSSRFTTAVPFVARHAESVHLLPADVRVDAGRAFEPRSPIEAVPPHAGADRDDGPEHHEQDDSVRRARRQARAHRHVRDVPIRIRPRPSRR